jgi:UDP-3-O-[3-hydroxymyristoyl] glucosamine N-acyltransferase
MKIINEFYHHTSSVDKKKNNPQNKKTPVISPAAIISKSARIGMDCSISNFTKIGDKCIIGG